MRGRVSWGDALGHLVVSALGRISRGRLSGTASASAASRLRLGTDLHLREALRLDACLNSPVLLDFPSSEGTFTVLFGGLQKPPARFHGWRTASEALLEVEAERPTAAAVRSPLANHGE